MRRILVVSADRAEKGLLDPIYDELTEREDVIVKWCLLDSHADPATNLLTYRDELEDFQPHIILLPTDRSEMVYAAAYSFHKGFVNIHFHAGNNPANHPDDINRRVISVFSHIMLCNMPEHKQNLINQGEEEWRIHVVGSTAFDNVEYDDTITPKEPFALVILHPDPDSSEATEKDLQSTLGMMNNGNHFHIVWIYPNHDKNYEIIENFLDWLKAGIEAQDPNKFYFGPAMQIVKNLPRSQYISLLKNCKAVIGNSSSFWYELPVFNAAAQRFLVGTRNKGLVVPKTEAGGSQRIANLLATIELTNALRVKRLNG